MNLSYQWCPIAIYCFGEICHCYSWPYIDTLDSWHDSMKMVSSCNLVFDILLIVTSWWYEEPSQWKKITTPKTSFNWINNIIIIHTTNIVQVTVICVINKICINSDYVLVTCKKDKIGKWKMLLVNDNIEIGKVDIYIYISFFQHIMININHYNTQMIIRYTIIDFL